MTTAVLHVDGVDVVRGARTVHPTRGTVSVLGHRLGHVDPRQNIEPRLPARDATLTGLTNTSALPPRRQVTVAEQQRASRSLVTMGMEKRGDLKWHNHSQGGAAGYSLPWR